MREREIIAKYFNFAGGGSVVAGVGDDAAVLLPPPGEKLATSTDTLIEGRHFFAGADSFYLARKAAAVSLSDMAATGARPLWMLVSLTAQGGETWFARFAEGLQSISAEYNYNIVGGDLCAGDIISITTTVVGAVKTPLLRSGARPGDEVWISGPLGFAACAAHCRKKNIIPPQNAAKLDGKLDNPSPRVALGQKLAAVASAAMDISDGLIATADAVAESSQVKMILRGDAVPVPPELAHLSSELRNQFIFGGGDDYELFFCAPKSARKTLAAEKAICIGEVVAGRGVEITGIDGVDARGYEHDFGG